MMIRHPAHLLIMLIPCTAAAALEPADTARICVAPATVEATTGSASTMVEAVRETLTSFLTGPTLGVQPLNSRLSSQVHTEAKQASCRYLLLTTVKQQHKSGSHILGRATGEAVQAGAWRAASSVSSAAGGVAASAVSGAASGAVWDMASGVKAKDELTLTYRLEGAGGEVLAEKSEKQKASSDGEDLLTPVVQRAAEAVAAAVSKGQ
jgi:uncharacterized protein with von Willebrand factor type A (vWA) domain